MDKKIDTKRSWPKGYEPKEETEEERVRLPEKRKAEDLTEEYTVIGETKYQTFDFDGWLGGRYVTPNLQGTRSGLPMAAAWAVVRFLGTDGYRHLVRGTLGAALELLRVELVQPHGLGGVLERLPVALPVAGVEDLLHLCCQEAKTNNI